MAFTYKSIGNTAAAVVSLLAVGTALWWNRTPGPIDAPRPQDEAEIMTAILERHYAMGRTTTKFTQTKPAYVSSVPDTNVVGGVRYITNSEAYTLTNTIGFFPNATFKYPQSIRDALAPGVGAYGTSGARTWLVPSNSYWTAGLTTWEWTPAMLNRFMNTETNWWTNYVTLSTRTILTATNVQVDTTNISSIATGYMATSSRVLPDGRYSAQGFDPYYTAWTPRTVFPEAGAEYGVANAFVIPSDGIDEYFLELVIYKFDDFVWTSAGGADDWSSVTNTFPFLMYPTWFGDILTVDYGVFTSYYGTAQQIVVTNTDSYNAWTAGKTFAFERDSKPHTWSTNAYNDMARALSSMQWQKNESQYTATQRTATVVIRKSAEILINNTDCLMTEQGCFAPRTFPTHYTDTNICFQEYARVLTISTNVVSLSPRMVVSIGELVPGVIPRYEVEYCEWRETELRYSGQTNWLDFEQTITLEFVSGNVRTTNETAFVWTNGYFFMNDGVTTNTDPVNSAMGVFNGMTSSPSLFLHNPWYATQGCGVVSSQICAYPLTGTGGDEAEWQAMLAAAMSVSSNIWNACGGVIPYSGYSITSSPLMQTIPYYIVDVAPSNRCAYRVQFSALTNYLDHAPAR